MAKELVDKKMACARLAATVAHTPQSASETLRMLTSKLEEGKDDDEECEWAISTRCTKEKLQPTVERRREGSGSRTQRGDNVRRTTALEEDERWTDAQP